MTAEELKGLDKMISLVNEVRPLIDNLNMELKAKNETIIRLTSEISVAREVTLGQNIDIINLRGEVLKLEAQLTKIEDEPHNKPTSRKITIME